MSANSLFRIAGWAAMLLAVVLVAAVLVTFAPIEILAKEGSVYE